MPSKTVTLKRPPLRPSGSLPPGTLRILQITDCHIYANPEGRLAGLKTQQTLDDVLEMAQRNFWQADMVLATGDLVHDATPAGYSRFEERFSALGAPVYCLPGNHDLPEVMSKCLDHSSVTTPKAIRQGNWLIVMLDSTIRGSAGGHLSSRELEALESNLSRHSDCHTLICLHHHPVPVGSAWMDRMALDNPQEFFSIIDRHPKVRGILWGHIHQLFEGEHRGVKLMGSPSTCIQFTPRQDEFGIDQQPPGLRWLELLPDGVIRSAITRLPATPIDLDLRTAGY